MSNNNNFGYQLVNYIINEKSNHYMKSQKLSLEKRFVRKSKFTFRLLTSPIRLFPSFIIFGVPRCGTTSLYNYLIQHPFVEPAIAKEIGFFEKNYDKGLKWYKQFFPICFHRYKLLKDFQSNFITGEATATYINNPHVPERIKKCFPDIKLIVLLRNPVDRAFSQYFKIVKEGRENLSFEDAINCEEERTKGEFEKMLQNKNYYSMKYHNFSYLSGGIYVDKLKKWFEIFPKEQILVLRSEDLYEKPSLIYETTLEYLNLGKWKLKEYSKYNYYENKPKIKESTRKKLLDYFEPHNERLYKFLNRDFGWNN